ncbi:uncharacterized protein LOC62_06G008780 [Vanrija pseudolonga]|uniref:Uncharacterized protein n=1 Tax=Vanrija pseudolonga TaxID=143232 RepID=A0AAF0YEK2_9TREE|nr:hypothetical protein LOC62_06G008780 [Vanrija pseudolonga]
MLALSRLAAAARGTRAVAPTATSITALAQLRHYAGDPGPSTHRQAQRRRVRESVAQGRASTLASFDQLQGVLDGGRGAPRERADRGRGERGDRTERRPREERPASQRSFGLAAGGGNRRQGFGDRGDRSGGRSEPRGGRNDRGEGGVPSRPRSSGSSRPRPPADDWVPRGQPAADATPYKTSLKIKKWIDRHPSPLSPGQVDEVINLVAEAPLPTVNAAVWNLVLALLGREHKYDRMWKAFNQMKRRGTKPTSRTFTTLLNAYAGVAHVNAPIEKFNPSARPERLTLDRVNNIYNQSQAHIRAVMEAAKDEDDIGIAYPSAKKQAQAAAEINETEVNIVPTNSYLKFLGRFGLWEEMQRVFHAMDTTGPLSPDQVTYSAMLSAANNIDHYRRSTARNPKATQLAELNLGATARGLWEQAVRQMCPAGKAHGKRELDEQLALTALECLVSGRPEDQRLVEQLVPRLWALPAYGQVTVASSNPVPAGSNLPASMEHLPRFKLNVKSATALMSLLARGKASVGAYYTDKIINTRDLRKDLDFAALRVAVHNLSAMNDVDAAKAIIESYQPPTGQDGWPRDVWHAVMLAARWSKDWDSALGAFSRMAQLPTDGKAYNWKSPNGKKQDVRGTAWVKPRAVVPDAESVDLLLKTALVTGVKNVRSALGVYERYGEEHFFVWKQVVSRGPTTEVDMIATRRPAAELNYSSRKAVERGVELAKTLEQAAERVGEYASGKEKEHMEALARTGRIIADNWGQVLKRAAEAPAASA